ncbi:MAG: HAD-IIIA family hydrolase [Tissierellia bacterium]|nr:HAD-IIIA family hydrolase [Tissierellia bacterium]
MDRNKIKMVVMDVDGTLTDGKIYMGKDGEVFKAFNAKDGLRIRQLPKFGIIPVIITGRQSSILTRRAEELGISEVYQGISNKPKVLNTLLDKYGLEYANIAYIGDDENDYTAMSLCGVKGCPRDAAHAILNIADFVSKRDGGNGAVRDFLDFILEDKLAKQDLNCEYE